MSELTAHVKPGAAWRLFGLLLAVVILPVFIMLQSPFSPIGSKAPSADPGAYVYTAWRILEGDRLYVDVWDHKGPLTFLLYIAGLSIGNGGVIGIWILNTFCFCLSSLLCFKLIQKLFGFGPAVVGSSMFVLSIVKCLDQGCFIEDMGLVYQCMAIYASALFILEEDKGWRRPVLGLAAGLSFAALLMLRANMVAPYAGLFAGMAIRAWQTKAIKPFVAQTLWSIAGIGIGIGSIIAFLMARSDMSAFQSAVLDYNLIYSKVPWGDRFRALLELSWVMFRSAGATLVLVVGLIAGLYELRSKENALGSARGVVILSWVLAAFITVVSSMLSGRPYGHYVTPWTPFVGLFAALLWWRITLLWANPIIRSKDGEPTAFVDVRWATGAFVLVCGGLILNSIKTAFNHQSLAYDFEPNGRAVAKWIQEKTKPTDTIYCWGDGGAVLWLSKRKSASKFFYSLPIVSRDYPPAAPQNVIAELEKNKPFAVVDRTAYAEFPYSLSREKWYWKTATIAGFYSRDVTALRNYVAKNFRYKTIIGRTEIYTRTPQ